MFKCFSVYLLSSSNSKIMVLTSERQRTGTTTLEATFRILMLYNVKVESSLDVPMGGAWEA